MTEPVRNFVLQLLQEKGPLPTENTDAYNYFDTGHIDSLGLIKFFIRIESHFGIELSDDDFSDPAIRTVGGLAALIAHKTGAGSRLGQ